VLEYWLLAQRHHRIVATVVVLLGFTISMIGLQQPAGSKLISVGTGIEVAGLIFLVAARRKAP